MNKIKLIESLSYVLFQCWRCFYMFIKMESSKHEPIYLDYLWILMSILKIIADDLWEWEDVIQLSNLSLSLWQNLKATVLLSITFYIK